MTRSTERGTSGKLVEAKVAEGDRVAFGFEAHIALIDRYLNGAHHLAVDGEGASAAHAVDVIGVPLAGGLDAVFVHLFLKIDAGQLAVDRRLGEDVPAGERGLRLVPDGSVLAVAEEDATVVFRCAGNGSEAPLDFEVEVGELMVEAQPLVALVAIAGDLARPGIDVPLVGLAERMRGRDGDAGPGLLNVFGEHGEGLRRGKRGEEGNGAEESDGARASAEIARGRPSHEPPDATERDCVERKFAGIVASGAGTQTVAVGHAC